MALATGEAWKKHPLQVNIPLQVRPHPDNQTSQLGRNCNSETLGLQLKVEPFIPMQLYLSCGAYFHEGSKIPNLFGHTYIHTEF